MLNLTPRQWKVSASWLSKPFNCTVEHILSENGCNGKCCHNMSTWPTRAWTTGQCAYLGPAGCVLPFPNRPITCILFPVTFIKSPIEAPDENTFVLWQRSIFPHSMCKGAYKSGPPLVVVMEEAFCLIFGRRAYERVKRDVLEGRDSYFEISDEILTEFQRDVAEDDYENQRFTPPQPRNYPTKG